MRARAAEQNQVEEDVPFVLEKLQQKNTTLRRYFQKFHLNGIQLKTVIKNHQPLYHSVVKKHGGFASEDMNIMQK